MAKKRQPLRELTTDLEPLDLRAVRRDGPAAPVSSYGKTRYYLQDGRWLPSWLVWLRRRKRLALALLALAAVGYGLARLIGGGTE
jgi:hypothetical protein